VDNVVDNLGVIVDNTHLGYCAVAYCEIAGYPVDHAVTSGNDPVTTTGVHDTDDWYHIVKRYTSLDAGRVAG
jgi:hypothetical protein